MYSKEEKEEMLYLHASVKVDKMTLKLSKRYPQKSPQSPCYRNNKRTTLFFSYFYYLSIQVSRNFKQITS
jgi:hypothetical protein